MPETKGGLLENLVKYQGEIKKVEDAMQAGSNDPYVIAAKQVINMLPEGSYKKLLQNPNKDIFSTLKNSFDFIKTTIFGRKYRDDEYRVVERVVDQISDNGNPNSVKSWRDVPDEDVRPAQQLMTTLFGVPIWSQPDLDALDDSVEAYYQRIPNEASQIPLAAVQRAVWLKKNKFPYSTYNTKKWDVTEFEKFPLVAPIPSIDGGLYTGTLPGGTVVRNGVIEGDSAIKQYLDQKALANAPGAGIEPGRKSNTIKWVLGLGIGGYIVYNLVKPRTRR